jgi:RNA polymerase sigma-70 factor (ECF subfamily)
MISSAKPADDRIPTPASLLHRLKDPADGLAWSEFYLTYRDLIYSVARRAGLTELEASEVVQDTLISVSRKIPGFSYDPSKDSFKGWLLTVTRWRIRDQLERRAQAAKQEHARSASVPGGQDTRTATIERLPDSATVDLAAVWEEEWEAHLLQAALARVKRQAHPQHYQIYHLHAILGQSTREVARALNVSTAQVYLGKHRVGNLIKKEVRELRKNLL